MKLKTQGEADLPKTRVHLFNPAIEAVGIESCHVPAQNLVNKLPDVRPLFLTTIFHCRQMSKPNAHFASALLILPRSIGRVPQLT